jgi:hypothetical protein
MRRFYLYERHGIFYVALIKSETERTLTGKSTGPGNREEVMLIIVELFKSGIPNGKKEETPDG